MNTTTADNHLLVDRKDLRQLARLTHNSQSEGTDVKTADIVPMLAKTLMRTQRLTVLVAAILITLFLVWVFVREKIGIRGIPDKAQSYSELSYYQPHKRRQVYGGDFGYAPDADNNWYVRNYDFGIVQDSNRNAPYFPFYSAERSSSGNPPIVKAHGTFTETGVLVARNYSSATETFDTRIVSFGGSTYLDKVKAAYFIAHTMGSYNRPFDESLRWQKSAPAIDTFNYANSNLPGTAVADGANPYDVSWYSLASFGNTTRKSIAKDWLERINVAIPTYWTSYPIEELKFGLGARVRRFDQNVTTYGATTVPAAPHSPAAYGSDAAHYQGHGDVAR
jgi:hypothetical protein